MSHESFEGIKLVDDRIESKQGGGPIAGAHARVEAAGQVDARITATRLLLTGPLALGLRKKKDHRELYLTIEGQGFAFSVKLDPKKGEQARNFAAKINAAATKP